MSVAPEPYKLALSHWPVMVACSDSLAVVVVMESGAVMNLQVGRTTDWAFRGKKSPMGEKERMDEQDRTGERGRDDSSIEARKRWWPPLRNAHHGCPS